MGDAPSQRCIQQELAKILASPEFAHAPRQSAFFEYLVNEAVAGHPEKIKESLIGVYVFHKTPGYDPKIDSTVRSEAIKLRTKLDEYYRTEGTKDRLIISLPKGSYVPQFAMRRNVSDRTKIYIAASTLGVAAILGIVGPRRFSERKPILEFAHAKPFTTLPGGEYEPTFSADGQMLAFVWDEPGSGNFAIYTKPLASERLTRIATRAGSPAWAPDGRRLAFIRYSSPANDAGVYVVPSYGGLEQKISPVRPVEHIFERHLDWSPTGKWLAVADRVFSGGPFAIYLLNLESGQRVQLTYPAPGSPGDTTPSFSPDGHTLAFLRTIAVGVKDIYSVDTGGGKPARLTTDKCGISDLAWSPDGKSLLFASERSGAKRLWRIFPATRKVEFLPGIADDAYFIARSRTGNRLAFSRWIADTNIWRVTLPTTDTNAPQLQRVIASTMDDRSAQYSPDGSRIVFRSDRSGAKEIWVSNSSGGNPVQLTSFAGPLTGTPRWSPDSLSIAFDSRPDGNADIFTIRAAGGGLRRLTTSTAEDVVPSWSADGKWVYFASNRSGSWQVWKVPSMSENEVPPPVQVTRNGGFASFASTDGKWIYYAKGRDARGLWRTPVDGGDETAVLPELEAGYWGYWTLGPRGIYFLAPGSGDACALRVAPASEGGLETLVNFPRCPPFGDSGLSISADGDRVLFTQIDHSQSDIFLADPFR